MAEMRGKDGETMARKRGRALGSRRMQEGYREQRRLRALLARAERRGAVGGAEMTREDVQIIGLLYRYGGPGCSARRFAQAVLRRARKGYGGA